MNNFKPVFKQLTPAERAERDAAYWTQKEATKEAQPKRRRESNVKTR